MKFSVLTALIFVASLVLGLAGGLARGSATDLPVAEKLVGHGGPIKAISISGDGTRALTASFDYSIILWDLGAPDGEIIHRMIGHDSAVNDVLFLPGEARAVSVSDDGSLGVWDLNSGVLIKRVVAENYKVLDVAITSDGKFAASARWDGTAKLYDLEKLEEIATLDGHRGNVNSVAFSQDGAFLYTAAYDGQILEWEVASARLVRPIYRHGWGVNSIARINDDQLLFGAIDGTVGVVSIEAADKTATLAERERPIQSVKVSRDGALLAYGDGSGQVEVFQAADLQPLQAAPVTFGPVWDFDFIPGTMQLFHVGLDDYAVRWQIAPWKLARIESKFPRRFQLRKSEDPGELEFQRKCSVCHTLTPEDANRAGPTLYGVFGREAGTLPGYTYSKTLLESDVIWNEKTIAQLFDDGPDEMMPGTKMPIQRLKTVSRRDDLIDFLKRATAPNQ